jgi:hypothetical protein
MGQEPRRFVVSSLCRENEKSYNNKLKLTIAPATLAGEPNVRQTSE